MPAARGLDAGNSGQHIVILHVLSSRLDLVATIAKMKRAKRPS